jgi:KRAB domain-containing zinc finger protein
MSEFSVLTGGMIQTEMETLPEARPCEELSFKQIWGQIASDLTIYPDSTISISQFTKEGESPCQVGTGLSLIHTGQKLYQDSEHTQISSDVSSSGLHQQLHSREKSHKCEECGKSFCYSSALCVHQRVHMGEKRHKCDVCGKEFSQISRLQTHQKVRTVEKPFKCEQCGKGFSQRAALNVHCKVHTGEKPYSCEVCGQAYIHDSQLQNISESTWGRNRSSVIYMVRAFVVDQGLTGIP